MATPADTLTWREAFESIPDASGQTSLWIETPTSEEPSVEERREAVERRASELAADLGKRRP